MSQHILQGTSTLLHAVDGSGILAFIGICVKMHLVYWRISRGQQYAVHRSANFSVHLSDEDSLDATLSFTVTRFTNNPHVPDASINRGPYPIPGGSPCIKLLTESGAPPYGELARRVWPIGVVTRCDDYTNSKMLCIHHSSLLPDDYV